MEIKQNLKMYSMNPKEGRKRRIKDQRQEQKKNSKTADLKPVVLITTLNVRWSTHSN